MAPPEEDEDGFARKLEMHTLAKSYKKLIATEERDRSTMPCKSDDFRRSNDTLTSPEDALSARTIGLPATETVDSLLPPANRLSATLWTASSL